MDLEQEAIDRFLKSSSFNEEDKTECFSRVVDGFKGFTAKSSVPKKSQTTIRKNCEKLRQAKMDVFLKDMGKRTKAVFSESNTVNLNESEKTYFQERKQKEKAASESSFRQNVKDVRFVEDEEEWMYKKRKVVRTEARRKVVDVDTEWNAKPSKKSARAAKPVPDATFITAKEKWIDDNLQKQEKQREGFKPPFLTKKPSGSGAAGKFAPPFTKQTEPKGSENKNNALSERTKRILSRGTNEIPSALQNFDPLLLEAVCSEILDEGNPVRWDDIAGQETAKRLVQELVVWPMLNPHLFQGTRAPARGLLLFGPPGTGKTLIGKAIASNINATFFSISASSLTSKWIGDGEKMVRILFAVAEALQPTVIFIDEIDSILSARKSDGEHESSRRIKTELLVQMDGCSTRNVDSRILILAATNRPQELDEAARRRLPKQLYIPLPCDRARNQLLRSLLQNVRCDLDETAMSKIVTKTEGYSGADMRNLIQEACQGPIRDQFRNNGADISNISESHLRPVRLLDFKMAARAQKPSVDPSEIEHYEIYDAKYGATIKDEESSQNKTMLKAVQHFRIATLRKHRIVKRTVRLRLVPKATAVDPRQFLIFDNVDGTARKEKNTLKTETSSSASAPSSRAEAEDWVEDKERVIVDWGSEEETPSTKQTEESRFRNEGTAHYKASSISVLLDDDRDKVLPLVPLGAQASFYSPQEFSTKLTWWGSALCGCVLFANSATWMAALSLSVPLLLPWGLAGLRNWDLQSGGKTSFMGIWHCQVLATDIIEAPVKAKPSAASLSGRPGVTYQQMVRLLIGDPWNGGARTEMVVPITTKDQVPNVGELCDLLVLSKTRTFRDFQVVREAFFPQKRVWLAEYPFINRDYFFQLIVAIQKQQNAVTLDQDLW